MGLEGQTCQGMVVAGEADGGGTADVADNLNAGAGFADTETAAGEYLFVAAGVQFGEALAELEFVAVDVEGAVGLLLALDGVGRQAGCVDAEEVAYTGLA